MKITSVFKLIFVLLLSITLFACSESTNNPEDGDGTNAIGGELNVAFPQQPPSLDNHLTTARATIEVTRNIFETLVTFDSSYNVKPMLAESWEQSEDGKTITFNLREGVLFHNGNEMLARDVVASMNRWLELTGTGKETFAGASFEAIDDYTVKLELAEPVSITLAILAFNGGNLPAIMPKETIENAGSDGINEYIGTGPYQFEEWKQDQYIHLTRFEDYQSINEPADGLYGKKEALVNDLYLHYTPDSHTTMSGLLTGEYDVAAGLPFDGLDQIKDDENITIDSAPDRRLSFYFNKKNGLFSNQLAREAVAIGINNEDILQATFTDSAYYSLSHNLMMSHQEEQWYSDFGKDRYNQGNVERAKELLEEAGYNGEEITILTGRDHDFIYNSAVVLQEQLENIGMNTKLAVYDSATVFELREDENTYDLYVKSDTPRPEPTSLLFMKSSFTGWTESPELDSLLHEIWRQPDLEGAQKLYEDLQKWYIEYRPIIKVGDGDAVYAYRDTVEGIEWLDSLILWNVSKSD